MPQTITETYEGQIIAGIFFNRENADKAVLAFRELNISEKNIQQAVSSDAKLAADGDTSLVEGRGFSKVQALYYASALRAGKTLVAVYEVDKSAPIIDIFDRYGAEYNPNGTRNVRDDVLEMTSVAIVGAAVGAAVGGPAGGGCRCGYRRRHGRCCRQSSRAQEIKTGAMNLEPSYEC